MSWSILANKITAITSRDNPKDIFDLYLIFKFYNININNILEIAHKKTKFEDADLIVRLKTFPVKLMDDINLIDKGFLTSFEEEYPLIIAEIIAVMSNE
ncbi:MAG: nucleotidyl transferase AbiEii/AbiGii toxin family protein [SAR324 cluster bacterium]|nr:nucleotidyl transferase AbiEii/AbiGii toxin family protein [SAR324 cluster bacterium]MBL7035526.1 nucleotidyl transferase AbiEii/AbiGii toxin family protein [SAR324 cluster bacterium]